MLMNTSSQQNFRLLSKSCFSVFNRNQSKHKIGIEPTPSLLYSYYSTPYHSSPPTPPNTIAILYVFCELPFLCSYALCVMSEAEDKAVLTLTTHFKKVIETICDDTWRHYRIGWRSLILKRLSMS